MNLLPSATSTDAQGQQPRLAVLPIGSFEQHSHHLPLIIDTVIACIFGQEIADTYLVHLLPSITMSCSHEHSAFLGTVSAKTLYVSEEPGCPARLRASRPVTEGATGRQLSRSLSISSLTQ
ncbi:creatininase family protein [Streptomyces sp. AP-93]|uniref:creatininase family protein n=1 Tax=Streptomyces sp. AP-93 TaxID=2929048 RepID=UPI001FAFABBE|nr:creatininase family protein [Streptomyces sp. AP-93]MCJ0868447.1 creatininase family protein [Streptomyces sp. AP-93]